MKNVEVLYRYVQAVGREKMEAIELHHQRYQEVGFFKPGEEDPYETSSVYFSASDVEIDKVVGVSRLIATPIMEFPTVKNFKLFDIQLRKIQQLDASKIVEMSAFTKLPQHDVGLGLLRACSQYSFATGITHWICCLDERVYNYLKRVFRFPFEVIGEPKVYLGSNTIPCLLDLKQCAENLQQARPQLYTFFFTYEDDIQEVAHS